MRKKKNKPKVAVKRAEGVSDDEIQRRLARAFDVLFTATAGKLK